MLGVQFRKFTSSFCLSGCLFMLGICISVLLKTSPCNAQENDFFQYLGEGNSLNEFIKPERSGRLLGFTGNETINKKRLQLAVANNNDKGIIAAASNLGLISLKKNDATTAVNYFQQSLDAAVRSKNEKATSTALIQSAIAQQQLKNAEKALEYYRLAASKVAPLNFPKVSAFIQAQTGQCYLDMHDLKKSEESFNRAAKAYSALGEKVQAGACYNSTGEVQLRQNNYKQALESFNAGLSVISGSRDNKLAAILNRNAGLTFFKQGKFEVAIEYFKKSISFQNDVLIHKLMKDAYMQLFTYYSFSNDFTKADFFHDRYRSLKDSLLSSSKNNKPDKATLALEIEEKERVIELLQKQYQEQAVATNAKQLELSQLITRTDIELQQKDQALEQKTAEVEQLTRDKAIRERDLARQELQISKQKNFRNLLIAITVGAIILIVLLYNRYKLKQNSNTKLQKANEELQNTLRQLQTTQDQLVQSEKMASLGQLTAGIAHEIQNPLNFVNNFSEGAIEVTEEFLHSNNNEERQELGIELKSSIIKIHEHGKRAERIVKSMLQHSRQGTGEKELTDLNLLIHESVNLAYHGMRATYKDFQCVMEEDMSESLPKMLLIPQDMNRVFLNLTNNAFYAMREKAKADKSYSALLKITTSLQGNMAEVKIWDNGPGIPKEIAEKVFQPFFTTKPTGQGTGLGLSMSFDIITKSHQGTLQLISEKDKYSEFTIRLPLS